MKRLLLALLLVLPCTVAIEATYLGNEGLLLEDGESSILIDALQGPGLSGYVAANEGLREKMETARPPFDAVDWVLFTHHHPDHFNVEAVARFIGANPTAKVISTKPVAERLSHLSALKDRLIVADAEIGKPFELKQGGVTIRAFAMHHGKRMANVPNLGFVVTQGETTWLHAGDTAMSAEEFERAGLPDGIDIFFAPYWHLLDEETPRKLAAVGAERVVPIHIPAADAGPRYFQPLTGLDALREQLEQAAPGVELFGEPGSRLSPR